MQYRINPNKSLSCANKIIYAQSYCLLAERTRDPERRVSLIIEAEHHIASLRAYSLTRRLLAKYRVKFRNLEKHIDTLKHYPLVREALAI